MKNKTKFSKELSPELQLFLEKETEFTKVHENDTDDELLCYLKQCTKKLGRRPNKTDIVGYTYIKARFGPWNRVLERAGLKDRSEKQLHKEEHKELVRKREEKKRAKGKNKNNIKIKRGNLHEKL